MNMGSFDTSRQRRTQPRRQHRMAVTVDASPAEEDRAEHSGVVGDKTAADVASLDQATSMVL